MLSEHDVKFFKAVLVEFFKEIIKDERLKRLFEKAKNINEIEEIMKNNSLSLTEKHIKMCKALIIDKIKQNDNFGPITKKAFESIVDSNIHPFEMIALFRAYESINDLKK